MSIHGLLFQMAHFISRILTFPIATQVKFNTMRAWLPKTKTSDLSLTLTCRCHTILIFVIVC